METATGENAYLFADRGSGRVSIVERGARRWSVVPAATALLQKASSCRSIGAYRSARCRLSSSAASTRFSPTGILGHSQYVGDDGGKWIREMRTLHAWAWAPHGDKRYGATSPDELEMNWIFMRAVIK